MRRLVGVVAVLALAVVACSGDDDDAATAERAETAADAGGAAEGSDGGAGGATDGLATGAPGVTVERASQLLGAGRSVIRTAEIEVRVADVDRAAGRAVAIAEGAGGFLAEQDSTLGEDATAHLVLRVPPERFGAALEQLGELGEVVTERVGSDDVSDVVVDLEGRLASARASVERLRALLADAADIPAVVTVESELARREGEVESLAGRLRALEAQVDLATVTVRLHLDAAAASPAVSDDIPGFLAGLRTGWVAFANVAAGGATALGFALPFLAVGAAVAGPTLWWRRRHAATVHG